MSRSALILSLALHAAVLVAVGKWFAASAGSGDSGAGTRFSPAAGGLLVEIAPAAEAAPAPLPPESELTPPAPTPETPTPVERWTAQNSPVLAPPALAPNAKAVRPETGTGARTTAGGSRASGASRGTAGSGPGIAGAGRGAGTGYVPPSFRLRYKPAYPEDAHARRLEGTVLLLVSLDARGRVTAAALQRTCGHGILDRAALAAVRSWLFEPARQDGAAIAAEVEIPIRFRFEERTGTRA